MTRRSEAEQHVAGRHLHRLTPRIIIGVALGAALGAESRYLVLDAFEWGVWSTLAVNLAGTAALGALSARSRRSSRPVPPSVGAGFLGAFTTFSAFMLDTYELVERSGVVPGALYLGLSLASGVAIAALLVVPAFSRDGTA